MKASTDSQGNVTLDNGRVIFAELLDWKYDLEKGVERAVFCTKETGTEIFFLVERPKQRETAKW